MTRSCFHCGAEIEMTDAHCPYCSAMQSKPGDPFIGFLLHHADVIVIFVGGPLLGLILGLILIMVFN